MSFQKQKLASPEVQDLRREGGRLLKSLREARRLSQSELAALVIPGSSYVFISEIERGVKRVPPDRFAAWAEALGVTPLWLAQTLMPFYDPVTFRILYQADA